MALVDSLGNLIDFVLMPGQRHDSKGVLPLIEGLTFGAFLGDKAFDSDKLRTALRARGAKAVIPPKRNRIVAIWWRISLPNSRSSAVSRRDTTKPIPVSRR